jgi:hypothetical protein
MASVLLVLDLVSETSDKSVFNRVYVSLVASLVMSFGSYKGGKHMWGISKGGIYFSMGDFVYKADNLIFKLSVGHGYAQNR